MTPLSLTPSRSTWQERSLNGLLIGAWFYLHLPALLWLVASLRAASRLNWILIGLVFTWLSVQGFRQRQHLQFNNSPGCEPLPLALVVGSGLGAIALRWFWEIQQLPVFLFALGTYGLIGLYLQPTTWRKGLPLAMLFSFALPFSAQFGTGLGWPARLLTARTVEQILHSLNISVASANDILVLENGIAQVDLPCSGLKSLWSGSLFFLAATWLEGKTLGIRWALVYSATLFMLVSANLVRVLILVLVSEVGHLPAFAKMLHVPLGVLGFATVCSASWWLLRQIPQPVSLVHLRAKEIPPASRRLSPVWVSGLAIVWLGLGIVATGYAPQPEYGIAPLQLPPSITMQALPLDALEQDFFGDTPNTRAEKRRFQTTGLAHNLSGSMLLVRSKSWNAFHPPELCLNSEGLTVNALESVEVLPGIRGRWLTLNNGQRSAFYWLQSPQRTTDDFLARLWEYVVYHNKQWVLVSMLFDQKLTQQSPEVQQLVGEIHQAIAANLHQS